MELKFYSMVMDSSDDVDDDDSTRIADGATRNVTKILMLTQIPTMITTTVQITQKIQTRMLNWKVLVAFSNLTISHSKEGLTSYPASYFPIRSLSAYTNDKDFCPLKEKSTTQTSKTSFSSDFPNPSTNHPKPVIHSSKPSPIQPQNQNNPAKAHFSNGVSRSLSYNKISSLKSSTTSRPPNKTRYSSVLIKLCQSQSRHPLRPKKRYASLKLIHPIHRMTQTHRKKESKNTKPLCSQPTKSTSTSSSNPTQFSISLSIINRCNHRILRGNNPQAASHHSNSNEVVETINVGVNLGFDISGKDRDIASIIGCGDHGDIK
ncbi:hypothetical protein Tco_1532310 [Tanacetum coccineum]